MSLKPLHLLYLDVQNRWYDDARKIWEMDNKADARVNKWWRLMEAIDECFPSARMELNYHMNPDNPIEMHLWLKTR